MSGAGILSSPNQDRRMPTTTYQGVLYGFFLKVAILCEGNFIHGQDQILPLLAYSMSGDVIEQILAIYGDLLRK